MMNGIKRVSVSFVLRFSEFQRTAEVQFGTYKSHRASSVYRPRPTAALIPSKFNAFTGMFDVAGRIALV
jgi:hypothetical protein